MVQNAEERRKQQKRQMNEAYYRAIDQQKQIRDMIKISEKEQKILDRKTIESEINFQNRKESLVQNMRKVENDQYKAFLDKQRQYQTKDQVLEKKKLPTNTYAGYRMPPNYN